MLDLSLEFPAVQKRCSKPVDFCATWAGVIIPAAGPVSRPMASADALSVSYQGPSEKVGPTNMFPLPWL